MQPSLVTAASQLAVAMAAVAAMAGHRIVDRRISASDATEYRMRKGMVSDPLRENPEDDHWQSSTSLPAEQVAAAEE